MKKTIIEFEVHNVTTGDLLCDNVPFEDIPELLIAYKLLYPRHQIEVCYREVTITERVHYVPREEFTHDWFEMLDDIIDNLYNS